MQAAIMPTKPNTYKHTHPRPVVLHDVHACPILCRPLSYLHDLHRSLSGVQLLKTNFIATAREHDEGEYTMNN
jgi:hypothetical protein